MIGMLIIQSIWDIRYREIPIMVTLVGGVAGLLMSVVRQREWIQICMALLPGMLCLFTGWLTREAIGYGDGFLLCAMGMYLSWDAVVSVGLMASFMAGMVALGLLTFGKRSGKERLPFVPFLFLACVVNMCIEGGWL